MIDVMLENCDGLMLEEQTLIEPDVKYESSQQVATSQRELQINTCF